MRSTTVCASMLAAWMLLTGCPKGHILYEGQNSPGSGSPGFEIWDIAVDDGQPTGSPVNLTNSSGDDVDPAWNQPTQRIAFASDRSGNFEIYTMDPDGSDLNQNTTDPGADRFPSWEPNGDRMVFASDADGDWDIYRSEDLGSRRGLLTSNNCLDTEPAWSPDGALVAFVSNCHGPPVGSIPGTQAALDIYVMDPSGGNITQLTFRPGTDDFNPTWSPDSTTIAFESVPTGGGAHTNTKIMFMDANGGNVRELAPAASNAGDLMHPAWSPDGNFLAVGMVDASGDYNVYTVNLGNNGVRIVVDEPLTQWAPAWGDPSR